MRDGVDRLGRRWYPARIDVVGDAITVEIDGPLLGIGDAIAVRVGVEVVGHAVAVRVGGALDGVGDAVTVRVGVEVVGHAVAVHVGGALLGVGDAIAVRVGVEVVGDAVTVRVRVDGPIGVDDPLDGVGNAVVIRVGVEVVGRAVAVLIRRHVRLRDTLGEAKGVTIAYAMIPELHGVGQCGHIFERKQQVGRRRADDRRNLFFELEHRRVRPCC